MRRIETNPHGRCEWWVDKMRHRDNGPAVTENGGYEEWWVDDCLHRADGPAITMPLDGGTCYEWWVRGRRHRVGAPAVVRPRGQSMWFVDGKLHRVDGPAVTGIRDEWWYDGTRVGATRDDLAALAAERDHAAETGDFSTLAVVLPLWHPVGPSIADLLLVLKLAQ